MDRPALKPATWRLPEGHESVGAYATQKDATAAAQEMARTIDYYRWCLYIMDKRGAWEIIRFPVEGIVAQ